MDLILVRVQEIQQKKCQLLRLAVKILKNDDFFFKEIVFS